MILKIMSAANVPDEAANAPCIVIADVARVILDHHIGKRQAYLNVWLVGDSREVEGERLHLTGNAYLMTDAGKTIQAFSPSFPLELAASG